MIAAIASYSDLLERYIYFLDPKITFPFSLDQATAFNSSSYSIGLT